MPESLQSVMWGVLAESLIIPHIFIPRKFPQYIRSENFLTGVMLLYTNENYLTKETSHTVQEVFT